MTDLKPGVDSMKPVAIPKSFQSRPFAEKHYLRIASWAVGNHPFYRRLAVPGEPLPVLTRTMVQEHNGLLLNGHPATARTSGSVSTPVEVSWSPARSRLEEQDTAMFVGWLGGVLPNIRIVSLSSHAKDHKTLDVITPIPEQVEFIRQRFATDGACSLVTYPTNLEMLCRHVIEHGIDMSFVRRCTCMSEVYESHLDALVSQAFPNAVATCTYSSVELGLIALRCPHESANYHIMAHKLGVEFLTDEGEPCRDGETGHVVITDYFNRRSTMVRYALGDLAAPIRCGCPIRLPAMTHLAGKVRGVLKDPSGRPIMFTHLSPMFRDSPEIRQFQVIQTRLDAFVIRYVAWPDADMGPFVARVRQRFAVEFGEAAEVQFESLPVIPRSAGGKFFGAICLI